jgi:hypothetical protein
VFYFKNKSLGRRIKHLEKGKQKKASQCKSTSSNWTVFWVTHARDSLMSFTQCASGLSACGKAGISPSVAVEYYIFRLHQNE